MVNNGLFLKYVEKISEKNFLVEFGVIICKIIEVS